MDPENLKDVGAMLFGSQWQTDLAGALGVSNRTVRRWVSGDTGIPSTVWIEIAKLCDERGDGLRQWAEFLTKESKK
jgi:plasmid maintenance system antidote protein VapI